MQNLFNLIIIVAKINNFLINSIIILHFQYLTNLSNFILKFLLNFIYFIVFIQFLLFFEFNLASNHPSLNYFFFFDYYYYSFFYLLKILLINLYTFYIIKIAKL